MKMTVNILKLFSAAPSESFPPTSLPSGNFSVFVTVGGDVIVVCMFLSVERDERTLPDKESPMPHFPEKKVSPREEKRKDLLAQDCKAS